MRKKPPGAGGGPTRSKRGGEEAAGGADPDLELALALAGLFCGLGHDLGDVNGVSCRHDVV